MINLGIIGLNGMGRERILRLSRLKSAQVKSICTRSSELLEQVSLQFDIRKVSTNWEDIISDPAIDAVIVCTPNNLHFEIARGALLKGKHVLVEYPLAVTLDEVQTLIHLASNAGVILHEGLTTRYEPHHLKVKELLPALGDPVEIHGFLRWPTVWKWAKDEKIMGSYFALANFHLVDQWVDIYGKPEWVNAALWKRKERGVLSKISGSMFIGYERGLSAYVSYSMGVPNQNSFIQFRLVHTEGMIEYRDDSLHVTRENGADETIDMGEIQDDSILNDTAQFIEEIENKYPNLKPEQTAAATRICLCAQQSYENGSIRIDITPQS